MKKILLYLTLFSFQIHHACYTSRTVQRNCHLQYTDETYRKDLGNRYFRENFPAGNKSKRFNPASSRVQSQGSKSNAEKLAPLLIIQSILPPLYSERIINRT